jgi:serine phosphatase RsbU (regulator of sigma subunit)/predicted XRE-type DNA-binding protein/Tfp pilus assembly protein PilF
MRDRYSYIKPFLLILFTFISVWSKAQSAQEQKQIDSLIAVTRSSVHDTLKIKAYQAWDDKIFRTDKETDKKINLTICDISKKGLQKVKEKSPEETFYLRSLAKSYNNLGLVYQFTGDFKKSLEHYLLSKQYYTQLGDKQGIAKVYTNSGNLYYKEGNLPKSLDCYFSSLKIMESIENIKGTALLYNNIGVVYRGMKQEEKAYTYFQKSLTNYKKIDHKEGLALVITNIGNYYVAKGDQKRALNSLKEAIALQDEIGDLKGKSNSIINYAEILMENKQYDSAMTKFNEALDIRNRLNYREGISAVECAFGVLYNAKKDYKKGESHCTEALRVAKELGMLNAEMNACECLYESYKGQNNSTLALSYYERANVLKDSIISDEREKEMIQKEFEFLYNKKRVEDSLETIHEKALQETKQKTALKYERNKRYYLYLGIGALLIFLFIIFNRYKLSQKQKHIIQEQKNLVEEKQKEILDSITYAKHLQEAILVNPEEINQKLKNNFLIYLPKDIVAGDFYFFEVSRNYIFIAAADCTGHGVPGAMMSMVCSNALTRSVKEFNLTDTGKILDKSRELILETLHKSGESVNDGMDISLLRIDTNNSNEIMWSGANNPLWISMQNEIKEIKGDKQPIGKTDAPLPFSTHVMHVEKNQMVYLFTDGLADQFGGKEGKKFKYAQMKKILLENAGSNTLQQKDTLLKAFYDWKGNLDQIDDVCVIGIRI